MTDAPKKKIKTLVVDDEPLARRNIRALLKDDPEIAVVGEAGSGAAACVAPPSVAGMRAAGVQRAGVRSASVASVCLILSIKLK